MNSNSKPRCHQVDFKQISNKTQCSHALVRVIQTKPKTIIPISFRLTRSICQFVNEKLTFIIFISWLSHCHPNIFTFPALKVLWTQDIAILILRKIVSHTEEHYFDHVVLTLESQNNSSRAEIYPFSYRTTYFSKTLAQEQHAILGTSKYLSFNRNSVKSLNFPYDQGCDLQSHHINSWNFNTAYNT